jgi:hypothetical protein
MKKIIILLLLLSFNASALNIKDIKFLNSEGKEVDISQLTLKSFLNGQISNVPTLKDITDQIICKLLKSLPKVKM